MIKRDSYFLFILAMLCTGTVASQNARPIRDIVGYCWNPFEMKRLVEFCQTPKTEPAVQEKFIAAISPHDDYLYAARVYSPVFRSMTTKEIVIFGVTHDL